MTFDELLAANPKLRFRRQLGSLQIRRLADRQKGECTWCGTAVKPPRRTWCSDDCVREYELRCNPAAQRQAVIDRDAWVCQSCGRDTKRCATVWRRYIDLIRIGSSNYSPRQRPAHWLHHNLDPHDIAIRRMLGYGRGTFGPEVDHIVRVADGGGLCGLDNLRTLCGVCHAVETYRD